MFIRIAVRVGIKVTHIVCDVDDNSVQLGITGETPIMGCCFFDKVEQELSEWCLTGNKQEELTVTKPVEKEWDVWGKLRIPMFSFTL